MRNDDDTWLATWLALTPDKRDKRDKRGLGLGVWLAMVTLAVCFIASVVRLASLF
jgi:hypothetical protein